MMVYCCRCRSRPAGKAMAELAASVGHQLIHVDYENNKHDYNNDNNVHAPSIRRIYEPGGGTGGGPGFLVDLNPDDLRSTVESVQPLAAPVRLSDAVVDTLRSAGDDSLLTTPLTAAVVTSDVTSSSTPCTRCTAATELHQLHRHHQHHHHHHRQQQQSLVYGQFCTDGGSFSDDRYPVGLRTPQ